MADEGYLLDTGDGRTGARLEALAQLFDPWTFAHLEGLGLQPGWRVWEVGAGGPSVVGWLAERVGAIGSVLATDIDISWVSAAAGATVEVRQHDVGADSAPGQGFDLVHARLVLSHVPARRAALAAMIEALRPGGWLVVEDADPALQPLSSLEESTEEERLANRIRGGLRVLLADRGADLTFGRTLPTALREAGLADVAAEALLVIRHPAAAILERATVVMIRDQLVEQGIVTAHEIDRHLEAAASGLLDLAQPPLVTAWGRRPSTVDRANPVVGARVADAKPGP